jgi:hypothetical protein
VKSRHYHRLVIGTALVTLPLAILAIPVGLRKIVQFGKIAIELPCKMATNLRSLPERMDPTCSECN